MNKMNMKIACLALLLSMGITLSGFGHGATGASVSATFSPGTADRSTAVADSDSTDHRQLFMIRVLPRAKGDSVILRWAPDQFVPWAFGNQWGYNLYRMDEKGQVDTLAMHLRPMRLEQIQQHFSVSDSVAAAAAQLIYGQGTLLQDAFTAGSDGLLNLYEEQKTRYALAMMIAEIRPDLAQAMGLKFTDRTAVKGRTYNYVVGSAIPDSLLRMGTVPVRVHNIAYKAPHYQPPLRDSLSASSITLYWPTSTLYTTHDVERRFNGGPWAVLNNHRFITLSSLDEGLDENIFEDKNLTPGTYEYRVRGYDAFGDVSNYSDIHRVELPDLIPPLAPSLSRFVINRDTVNNRIYADIFWSKPEREPDFIGYQIYYYNKEISQKWERISPELLAPNDTVFRADVTEIGSGLVSVIAIDTLGNYQPSTPYELHVSDLQAPSAPTGLRYTMSPYGHVLLRWNRNPEHDVSGYEVFSANSLDHQFIPIPGCHTADTLAFDTLQVQGINQKYLYYKVRAYDFSGNPSPLSEPLTVVRKNYTAPYPCRPDSTWMTDDAVHMRWYPSTEADIDSFYVYRRLEGSDIMTHIQTLPVDSVRNGYLYITDHPQKNPHRRYYYAVQSMNLTGVSSELSIEVSFLFKGPYLLPLTIHLDGAYRKDQDRILLGWKTDNLPQEVTATGYFCIYRKLQGETAFQFLESVSIHKRLTSDRFVPVGERAEYQMRIRMADGRMSPLSNRITVLHPAPEKDKDSSNL